MYSDLHFDTAARHTPMAGTLRLPDELVTYAWKPAPIAITEPDQRVDNVQAAAQFRTFSSDVTSIARRTPPMCDEARLRNSTDSAARPHFPTIGQHQVTLPARRFCHGG